LTKNLGGKKKFAIVGIIVENSFFCSQKILALYDTKSEAIQRLDGIQKYLESSDKKTYQMN
jgi:hypothetical protein